MLKEKKTANYRIVQNDRGNIYEFFCDLSGALVYTTTPVRKDNPEEELIFAWESEAKKYFNVCHKCGKWVINAMYNPEVFHCVQCSPFEDIPDYCPECGKYIEDSEMFCPECGTMLMYGDESDEDNGKVK